LIIKKLKSYSSPNLTTSCAEGAYGWAGFTTKAINPLSLAEL